MSSLIVSHDLHIMTLELAIEKLSVPKIYFASTTTHKTIVMFRIADDWLSVTPQCQDSTPHNGSNSEEESFRGGISVIFAVPAENLQRKISNLSIEVNVRKDTSKYFATQLCHDVGLTRVPIESLFNGIIKDLKERKDMHEHFSYFHAREPISRSVKNTYMINCEHKSNNSASITIYTRLNYLGKSIITEIESFPNDEFHVHEETCEGNPYQCCEVSRTQFEIGCWNGDNSVHSSSVKQKDLICSDDVNIPPGVKAEAEGALDTVEQKGITMNATDNTRRSKEFTSNNVGSIAKGISKRLSKDEKMTMNENRKGLDNADVRTYSKYENRVKKKDETVKKNENKTKTKKKKKTRMKNNDKGEKWTSN